MLVSLLETRDANMNGTQGHSNQEKANLNNNIFKTPT